MIGFSRTTVACVAVTSASASVRLSLASAQVQVIPLTVPPGIAPRPFGDKMLACTRAEALAQAA